MAVHDLPDYTREMIIKYTGGFIGLEELAFRLGAATPWDLQGNCIFIEDFESESTELDLLAVGTGSIAARSSAHKWSGDWSLHLVAGDEVDATTILHRYFPTPGATKLGIFTRLGFIDHQKEIILEGVVDQGTARYNFGLRYRGETNTLEYLDNSGNYQLLSDAVFLGFSFLNFWPFLLVVDLATGKYLKAVINNTVYDLSSLAMWDLGTGVVKYGEVDIYVNAIGAFGTEVYVDDIIVVKNVP